MNTKTKLIVIAALMAALTCIATMIIMIPSPLKGYLNLGDCIVLTTGWLLSPAYGFLAAGIGSALADVFSGYVMYAPATFLIKGLMAVLAGRLYKLFSKKLGNLSSWAVSGTAAEILMITGYFIFEGCMYGWIPSAVNIPANGIQGIANLIIGIVLIKTFHHTKTLLQ